MNSVLIIKYVESIIYKLMQVNTSYFVEIRRTNFDRLKLITLLSSLNDLVIQRVLFFFKPKMNSITGESNTCQTPVE